MISPMGASPAPSALAGAKAFGLTQQSTVDFGHVPLNPMDWPGTILARRPTFEPLLPRPNCFQVCPTPPVCVPPATALVPPLTKTGLVAVLTRQAKAHSGSGFSL